jgi:ABC-type phosphate transport system substrate-binding protein
MRHTIFSTLAGGLVLLVLACSPSDRPSQGKATDRAKPATKGAALTGAGATFPNPI